MDIFARVIILTICLSVSTKALSLSQNITDTEGHVSSKTNQELPSSSSQPQWVFVHKHFRINLPATESEIVKNRIDSSSLDKHVTKDFIQKRSDFEFGDIIARKLTGSKTYDNPLIFNNPVVYNYPLSFGDSLTFNGPVIFNGPVTFRAALSFEGILTFNGPLIFNGPLTFDGPVVFNAAVNFKGPVIVSGTATLNGGPLKFNGPLKCTGPVIFHGPPLFVC